MKYRKKLIISSALFATAIFPIATFVSCSNSTDKSNEEKFLDYLKSNVKSQDIEEAVQNKVTGLQNEITKWNENNEDYLKIKVTEKSVKSSFKNGAFAYEIIFNTELQGIEYQRKETVSEQNFTVDEDVKGSKQVGFVIELTQTNSRINPKSVRAQPVKTMVSAKNFLTQSFLDKTKLDDFDNDNQIVKNIRVNHSNDIHGRLSEDTGKFNKYIGLNNFAAYFNSKNPDLLLDAGDYYQGTGVSNNDNGVIASQAASIIGFDGISAGNHEFDFGKDNFLEQSKIAPFYSSNIKYVDNVGNKEVAGHLIIPGTKVKTIKGDLQVGLIPLTTEDTEVKANPNNTPNLEWENIIETTRKQIASLKAMGVNLIVVYGHLGDDATSVRTSVQLAEAIDEIDLIIDGHSHKRYEVGRKVNNAYLVQTGSYTQNIGEIQFDFNKKTGKIENYTNKYINLDEFLLSKENLERVKEVDKLVEEAVNNYRKSIESEVFTLKYDLADSVIVKEGETPTRTVRTLETNIGNFFADAMKWYAEENSKNKNIIAIQNGGGIRTSIDTNPPDYKVSEGQILEVSPFNNYFNIVEITGKQLKDVFNFSATKWQDGGFLQISNNLKVSYKLNAIPSNSTDNSLLEENKAISIKYNDKEISVDDVFSLVINDFMNAGGDGYEMLKGLKELTSGVLLTDVLKAFGKELNSLDSKPDSEYKSSNYQKSYIKPSEASRIKITPVNDVAKEIINKFNSVA